MARCASRVQLHFTPTSAWWLNLVKRWFAIITGQAIRRGSFDSVRRLEAAIMNWLSHWNDNSQTLSLDQVCSSYQAQHPKCCTYSRDTTLGTQWAITYVKDDKVAYLKGCTRAGFQPCSYGQKAGAAFACSRF